MNSYEYNSDAFWAKVEKTADCWEWRASRFPDGYGQVRVKFNGNWRSVGAHRVAYQDTFGPIAAGAMIDHRCHNTACVNPSHLRLATAKQNAEHKVTARKDSASGIRGVSWKPRQNRWLASVGHNGRRIHIGYFHTSTEAAEAVTAKRNELFTHNDADRKAAPMTEYFFTKEQAAKVARDLIVGYHENTANENQDTDRLAFRISGILGIPAKADAVENALYLLDELARVDRGTHEDLVVNRSGTIDNTPELIERLDMALTDAIDDVTARFRDHMELAA
jgi:hypothetical protein